MPAAASSSTCPVANPAVTVRRTASAEPWESSTSPAPATPVPTAAAWWSWPAIVTTAPASSGWQAVPIGCPAATSGGISDAAAPDHASSSAIEGLLRHVQPAGAAGQRPLADLVGTEPARHPLRDVEPPHGRPAGGHVRGEPAVLGQRVLVGRRLAGAAGEARGVDVADELLDLGAVAAVVPGDGGRQGRAVPVDEHPGLAHAGDADTADRPARRPQRLPDGGEGALAQRQRVHLDAVRPGVPGRGRRPDPTGRPASEYTTAFVDDVPTSTPSQAIARPAPPGPCAGSRSRRRRAPARRGRRRTRGTGTEPSRPR